MSRLVILPPEHGVSAYLNIRCRDERSGRECLQRGLNLTTNKRTKMGVRASPVRGRGGGCAEAPLAGLPPHGPPSLTQSAAEVAPTGATATRAGSSACIFVSGRCSLSVYRSGRTLSFAEPVVSMRRNPLRTHRPTVFVYFEANGHPCSFMSIMVAQTCGRKMRDFADPRFRGRTPLSNGLSLVPARPSTINPRGVRYASVRPLRLRLRGDRGRPRTRRRLSSGDGPRLKTGAFRCRTISPSLRTMPSIWPVR
jgi:hypothetical protein